MHIFRRFLLLFLLMPAIASAQNSQLQPRIVGGQDASPGEWPWMVALVTPGISPVGYGQFCGGSLINERWVLTAAHCVVDDSGFVSASSEINVIVNDHDLRTTDGSEHHSTIQRIIVHPDFNLFTLDSDLALLELVTPATGMTMISPLTATGNLNVSVGDSVTVTGWGSTVGYHPDGPYPDDPGLLDVLQEVDIQYVATSTCEANLGGLTDNMFCAGVAAGGKDSCQGDSGGPLMINLNGTWHQMGIVSWGLGCASAGYYGVYTRVSNFEEWINGIVYSMNIADSYELGASVVNQAVTITLTVNNDSSQDESITSISFVNSSAVIEVISENCTMSSLAAGESCEIDIQVKPSLIGASINTLEVTTLSSLVLQSTVSVEGVAVQLFDTHMGSPGLVWGSSGDGLWATQGVTGTEGTTSLQSADISNNQVSILVANVSLLQAESIYFNWKVSSEFGYDFLEVYLDGVLQDRISGEVDWTENLLMVPAGNHVISWVYKKDQSLNGGQDTAWIDNVSIGSPNTMMVFNNTSPPPDDPSPSTPDTTDEDNGFTFGAFDPLTWVILFFVGILRTRRSLCRT